MASKAKGKKCGDVISALKAFETTLRASCRHSQVPVYRPLLEQLKQHQDLSQPLTAVVLSGSTHPEVVAAVADCLASYPAAKSFGCLGCCVGDKGLGAISALLQSSCSKWWHGCRLSALEISNASRMPACRSPLRAPGHQQLLSPQPPADSLPVASQPSPPAATQNMHGMPPRPGSTEPSCRVEQGHQAAAAGRVRHFDLMRPATAPQSSSQHHYNPPAAICPALPGYLLPDTSTSPQRAGDDIRLSPLQLREVHYKVKAPKTMMEIRTWALAPTLGPDRHPRRPTSSTAPSSPQGTSSQPDLPDPPSCFSPEALQQLSLSLRVTGLMLQRLVLDHTLLGDQGASILAVGLGACSTLKVLSMRYCGVGHAGAQALAEALVPACKQRIASSNSSSSAAAGAAGARAGLSCLNPQLAPAADVAAGPTAASKGAAAGLPNSGSSSPSSSSEPQLVELHLDGNPLAAAGLHAVSKALRLMRSIKVVTLADVSVDCHTPQAALEVQVLAHSLLAGPNELSTLDFTNNHISDECAVVFVGLLKGKPSITLLKLTPRLSPSTMQQLTALLEEHQRAAKAARTAKKPKKQK